MHVYPIIFLYKPWVGGQSNLSLSLSVYFFHVVTLSQYFSHATQFSLSSSFSFYHSLSLSLFLSFVFSYSIDLNILSHATQ